MKKLFSFLGVLSLLIIESLLTFSCEVGLGSAVDVTAPSVVISSPKDSAVVRGDFALMGTWSDDGILDKVNVVLNSISNSSIKYEFNGEFSGNDQNESKNWRCVINPLSELQPITDGEYKATVYAVDTAGHATTVTKTFTIDNTPPVIVLQRPGTKFDDASVDSYGQIFTLEGQGADSSNIDHIDIHIFDDADCLNHLKTVTLNNVPLNIKLDVAAFKDESYTAIYGSAEKNGEKRLYCKMDAYDSAQKYPTEFGKNQSAEDTKGNKTSSYYLYDNLAADILSKYNIARLYEMMNGTYTLPEKGTAGITQTPEQIMGSVKDALKKRVVKTGSFTLNPENSPKFTVNGKDALLAENLNIADVNQGYFVTNGSDITVEVTPGLDGTSIVNSTEKPLKVYVKECDSAGNVLSDVKIYPKLAEVDNPVTKSGSTYKIYINLDVETAVSENLADALKIGKMYKFGVEGEDLNGNAIIPSASTGYGFYLDSSGRAPELKIENPAVSTVYLKGGDGFTVTGYTIASEGIPNVKVFIGDSTAPVWQRVFTESEGLEVSSGSAKRRYNFTATVPAAEFSQTEEKDYSINIASSIGDKTVSITKTIWYDLSQPEINFINISPVISSYEFANAADKTAAGDNINSDGTVKHPFINGKVRFRGTVEDSLTRIKSVEWHIIQNNLTVANIGGTIGTNFNFELDTTAPGIADNKDITVSFTAEDFAGNKQTANLEYFVCQNTDKPVAGPNNPNAWTALAQEPKQIREGTLVQPADPASRMNKISAGSSIYAKVTDDDGIKEVKFKVEKLKYDSNYENSMPDPDQSSVPSDIGSETITDLGSPVETISHAMPSSSGYFKVTITVTDLNDVACSKSFVVQMTGAAPDVTVTNQSDYIKNGEKVKLEVKMTGESPFTIVILQNDGSPNWQESSPIIENGNTKLIDVTPIEHPVTQQIKVRVTDNSSGVTTKEVDYKVDNTAPDSPVIESPSAGATGNNSLSGTTFVFSGKANDAVAPSANETSSGIKKLYYAFMTSDTPPADNSPLWNSQAATSGTWNINATLQSGTGTSSGTTLYEGKYWLCVKSKDGAGNQSSVVKREFTVDQTAPSITEVKLEGAELSVGTVKYFKTTSGNFTISGKVTDSNGIDSVIVNGNNIGAVDSVGTWSSSITRSENGQFDFSVHVKDKAGRTTVQNYSIFCDTLKPSLSITNPDTDLTGENSLAADSYTFRASANDSGSGVETFKYMISQTELPTEQAIINSATAGTNWEAVTSSSFSVKKDLIEGKTPVSGKIHEGKWYLYTYAKDKTGTPAAEKRMFWVDKKAPTLMTDDIASVTKDSVTVKGTATDANGIKDVKVKITPRPLSWSSDTKTLTETEFATGQTYTAGSGNDLPDGNYTIQITATDNAGKTATQTKTVLVDTITPNGTVSVLDTANHTETGGKKWYKKESIKIKFLPTTDSGCEVAEVKAKLRKHGNSDTSGTEELVKRTSSSETWWEATLPASEQGRNEIYLFIKDKAGNTAEKKSPDTPDVYIDSESPDDCIVYNYVADDTNYAAQTAITGSTTINGKIAKTFVVKAQDNDNNGADTYSGMKGVYYKWDSSISGKITATVLSEENHTYKITIPANTASIKYQKTGTVKFYLEDKVSNIYQSATFSFVLDETPPTVQINPLTDALTAADGDSTARIDVNGKINLSGTSGDGYKVDKVGLKYFVGNSEPDWATATGIKTVDADGTTSWTASINTAAENDNANLYIKALAQDEAGNIGESGTMILYINQDSDRPIITFSNLDLAQSPIWLKGVKNAYGSVFDDDGITSFEYKKGTGGTYKPITITNGSWNKDMEEGENDIYFKIVDKEGKTFETGTAAQPKLKSRAEGQSASTFKNGILTIKVDTTSPIYSNLMFATKTSGGVTSSFTSDSTTLVLGGIYEKLILKLSASDQNGVVSVKAELENNDYDATIEGSTPVLQNANKKDSSPHLWTFPDISIPDTLTGPVTLRLTITDQSGTQREDNINLTVDNTKPVLSFTSHNSGATVFATSDVTVRGSVDSTDLAEWKYALTNISSPPALTDAAFKPLIDGSTSFTLVFDGGSSTPAETHEQKLFKRICALEGISETLLQSDDNIRDLYIHIYGKDIAGNVSDVKTLMLKAIPNGDKPIVSYSYPAANGAALGGILRVTGSSMIQTNEVDGVYIQIDPSPTISWEKSANGTYYKDGSEYKKYTGSRYKKEGGTYTVDVNGDYVLIGSVHSLASDVLYSITEAEFSSANWKNNLKTAAGIPYYNSHYQSQIVSVSYSGGSEDAIKTSGSLSGWNITLNSNKEFDHSAVVALRVFAVSKTNKKSDAQTIWFRMDPDAPQIGSTTPLELVQYASGSSGAVVARRNYEPNMWITGEWYLTGSVTDDSGIKRITYKKGSDSAVDLVEVTDAVNNVGSITNASPYKNYVTKGSAHSPNFDYNLNIPVGSNAADGFGVLSYEISAMEGATQSLVTKQTIILNYDNKAPEFAATTSDVLNKSTWAEKLGTQLHPSGTEIKNSAGTYGFYGIADESGSQSGNQSGFAKVAMYFTRIRADGKTYVIDPMRSGGSDGLENFMETGADFEAYKPVAANGDGLYWLKKRKFIVSGTNILTAKDGGSLHQSIRKGGLVKVNGAIYSIDTVDSANKKVTVKGTLPSGEFDAYFAVCQVVDNFTQENGTTAAYNPSAPLPTNTNDDGDQMIEGVIESGTMCTWKAFIDSKLILDGGVTLHFVAFDKAGNATEKTYSATVKNNAPRLYGVKYGTDVNGNGTIDENEYIKTFHDKYSVLSGATTYYGYDGSTDNPVSEITATERLTVKTGLSVVPRVVGGNLGLGYTYKYKQNPTDSDVNAKSEPVSGIAEYTPVAGHSTDLRPDSLGITVNQEFFIRNISDGRQAITFNLWDKTDGTTAGTDSNCAKIIIPVDVAVQDAIPPTAVLLPFKWINASENSLYANSKKNGHIELEADLPSATFTATGSGISDRDPKISGIVTFEGKAKDNVIVKEIVIKIPEYNGGSAFTIATRGTDGKLVSDNMLTLSNVPPVKTYDDYKFSGAGAKDWYFEVLTDKFEADGSNIVEFKFHFDTQKIADVAKTDVKVSLSAKDRGKASIVGGNVSYASNVSDPGNVQTTADANTGYYKTDVVPYITGVETALTKSLKTSVKSAYSRTALGHYITRRGEKVSISGFNLTGAKYGVTSLDQSNGNVLLSVSMDSGEIELTVNNVSTINNMNDNFAKGSYAQAITDNSSYEVKSTYAYNSMANGKGNNLLTDNVYFDVWEFDSNAAKPVSGELREPVMKINPKSGKIGFAFVAGPSDFSMGHGKWESYKRYQRNYATFSNISFAYDELGNSFGTTTGLDTYPDGPTNTLAGRFTFMTSKWGDGENNMNDNYRPKNKIRFEAIGIPGNNMVRVKGKHPSTYTMTETRFASPSMAVTNHNTNDTSVYLAYYDDVQGQIRFRYGKKVTGSKGNFDNFVDNQGIADFNNEEYNKHVFEAKTANFSLIAGIDYQQESSYAQNGYTQVDGVNNIYFYDTGYKAYKYVAIDAYAKDNDPDHDVVVAVWSDGTDCWYAYNDNPTSGKDNGTAGGWKGQKKIFSEGGEYCSVKIAPDNSIHIAANVDGNLRYAYLASPEAAYNEATDSVFVDSYTITGDQINIDVGRKQIGTGYYVVPYISYYMSTSRLPAIAHLVIPESKIMNYKAQGTDDSDNFTGSWEVSLVPSPSSLSGGVNDKINVGLWKKNVGSVKGVITACTDSVFSEHGNTSANNSAGEQNGNCFGNGTQNPVLGYAIKASSGTVIETAQIK